MRAVYLIITFLTLCSIACHEPNKNIYAIKDFPISLQPVIKIIVANGIVGWDTATRFLTKSITDKDLTKLSKSEHPVLRAVAFREILNRTTFNHYDIIMNNLNDTATVATDAGEWGIRYFKVSDDLIQHGKWKDSLAKDQTIDALILKHNFLHSAYTAQMFAAFSNQNPKEKYYNSIKQMATRQPSSEEEYFPIEFEDIEYALYSLARFKKTKDIPIIKDILLKNWWRMSERSFKLMEDYPNLVYLEVYKKYYPRTYYRLICRDQKIDDANSFITSLATYKNKQSAQILDSILNRKPFMPCPADTDYLKSSILYAIWNNKCEAYSKLRSQVERQIHDDEENCGDSLPDPMPVSPVTDSAAEPIPWW